MEKNMKKLGIILIITMLLLSGCSGSDGAKDKSEKANSDAETTDEDGSSGQDSGEATEKKPSSKENVDFEDPIFERYIRSYLGKSQEDKISAKELSELTELVIDRRFFETDFSVSTIQLITLMRMDLSDLKLFPNHTKLEIQNNANDIFYSLDAIESCSKLEELSMAYDLSGYRKDYYFKNAYGSKLLDGIMGELPNLKKVELGNLVSGTSLAELQGKYPGITITNGRDVREASTYKNNPGLITTVSELNDLPKDTKILNMLLNEGENVNEAIEKAAAFSGLTVLRLVTKADNTEFDLSPLKQHATLEEILLYGSDKVNLSEQVGIIKNEQVLETIPNLRYLSLGSMSVSDKALATLKNLKTVSLIGCEMEGFSFLSVCKELYQLTIMGGYTSEENREGVEKDLIKGMMNQNLQYLTTYMTGPLLSYCPEMVGQMTKLKDFTTIEASDDNYFNRFDLSDCKNLKRVVFSTIKQYDELDLSILNGLDKLELLWIDGCNKFTNIDTLSGLTNLLSLQLGFGNIKDADFKQLEDFTKVLIGNPKVSAVLLEGMNRNMNSLPAEIRAIIDDNSKLLHEAGIYDLYYGDK
jgi:hypothetical protein